MADFSVSFVAYVVTIAFITWMYSRQVGRLERQLAETRKVVMGLAMGLHLHLNGKHVSMDIIPLRTDEEEK